VVTPQGLGARLALAGGSGTVDPSNPTLPHAVTGLVQPPGDLSEIGLVPAPAPAAALYPAVEDYSAKDDAASIPQNWAQEPRGSATDESV